jgi:hypothetical protein
MRFNTLKRMSNYVDQFRVGQISGYSLSRVWVKQCLCVTCAPLAYRDFANRALVKRFIPFPAACEDAVIAKKSGSFGCVTKICGCEPRISHKLVVAHFIAPITRKFGFTLFQLVTARKLSESIARGHSHRRSG